MPLSQADAFKSIEPVQRKHYGLGMKANEAQFSQFFKVGDDKNPIRNSVEYGGHRQFAKKDENSPVTMGNFNEGDNKQWRSVTYAGGYVLSQELIDDSRMREIKGSAEMLGRAAKLTPEYLTSTFLGRAFNSSYAATWDGKELCATDHSLPDRVTTVSNELATTAALSETALQDIVTELRQMKGPDNMRAPIDMDCVIVPSSLWWVADQIAGTEREVGSANNTKNVVRGKFKVANFDYLVSQTQWFVKTKNLPTPADGLFWDWRKRPEFMTENVVQNYQKAYISVFRARWGCEDFRGIFGSNAS